MIESVDRYEGVWSIIAPTGSPLWSDPFLKVALGPSYQITVNMCNFGSSCTDRFALASTSERLVRMKCPCTHVDRRINESSPSGGSGVTPLFCQTLRRISHKRRQPTARLPPDPSHVQHATFTVTNSERKRPIGQVIRERLPHASAHVEHVAGMQRRTGRAPLLLNEELEQGETVGKALKISHPSTRPRK